MSRQIRADYVEGTRISTIKRGDFDKPFETAVFRRGQDHPDQVFSHSEEEADFLHGLCCQDAYDGTSRAVDYETARDTRFALLSLALKGMHTAAEAGLARGDLYRHFQAVYTELIPLFESREGDVSVEVAIVTIRKRKTFEVEYLKRWFRLPPGYIFDAWG